MLAKVANRLYWVARYLERIESTARIINVYDQLLYDLPSEVNISWYSLIELSGLELSYDKTGGSKSERDVVQFLVSDPYNPSSIISNLRSIRENVRTTRDVLPEQSWEQINEFHHYLLSHLSEGRSRHTRHAFLKHIVGRCQRLNGLLLSSMAHDQAWQFLRLGRDIERADMTTRIVDSGAAALTSNEVHTSVNLEQVIWGHVLRSAEAASSYRRIIRGPVSREHVPMFLMTNEHFPRTVVFCMKQMLHSANQLPDGRELSLSTQSALQHRFPHSIPEYSAFELREYINDLQIEISELHDLVVKTWFVFDDMMPEEKNLMSQM